MDQKKLEQEIVQYSKDNGYLAEHFAVASCDHCGHQRFNVSFNADEGVAARTCSSCESEHAIGDSDEYIEDVEDLVRAQCRCGGKEFEVMGGVALYASSVAVRWFYLGLECAKCGSSAVYGDWKHAYDGYAEFLERL